MSALRFAIPIFALVISPVFAGEIGSFDRTLNVSGPLDLDISTGAGSITVRPGDGKQVKIHGTISSSNMFDSEDQAKRAREIESNPPIEQTGNWIRIGRFHDEWLSQNLSISYEVVAPAATKLRARTGSGGESIEGIEGPVDASSGSGGVRVFRIQQDVRVSAGSGTIQLDSIKGQVSASTGSGGIRDDGVQAPVTARAGSGGIRLRLNPNLGFDLHARTGSGGVFVGPAMTTQGRFERHEVRGQIRGGGSALNLSTGSGGVRVE